MDQSTDFLLTVDEAAALLRVNRKTLYEAIRLQRVPGVVRVGKVIRIGRSALVAWASGSANSVTHAP